MGGQQLTLAGVIVGFDGNVPFAAVNERPVLGIEYRDMKFRFGLFRKDRRDARSRRS